MVLKNFSFKSTYLRKLRLDLQIRIIILPETVLAWVLDYTLPMNTNQQPQNKDQHLEEALSNLERSQKEFENHWMWKKLGCKPKDFFAATKKHIQKLSIPEKTWRELYSKTKQSFEVKLREQNQSSVSDRKSVV